MTDHGRTSPLPGTTHSFESAARSCVLRSPPVHRLLGGKFHDTIDFFGFVQGREPEAMAEDANRLFQNGFQVIYYKVGYSKSEDVAITRAIREKLGDGAVLRTDVNELYSVGEAKRLILRMDDYRVDWVEQPVGVYDVAGMALLRKMVPVRLAIDQGTNSLEEIVAAIRQEAADVYVVGSTRRAGYSVSRKPPPACRRPICH